MRIHSDKLTVTDIYHAAAHAGGGDYRTSPVRVDVMEHGSRSRARAFNVSLTGTSSRRPNNAAGGRFRDGVGDAHAATWDEWGMFLGELFRRDPDATVPGVYHDGEHFRWATGDRFKDLTPADQCSPAGHKWGRREPVATGSYYVSQCQRENCGATQRHGAFGYAWSDIS